MRPQPQAKSSASSLDNLLGKEVLVNLRVYQLYMKGVLAGFDEYSNIVLEQAAEFEKNAEGVLIEVAKYAGQVLVRGEAILNLGKSQ
jgi:small nuclear ribonucleoprotein (snRNP)-like protein